MPSSLTNTSIYHDFPYIITIHIPYHNALNLVNITYNMRKYMLHIQNKMQTSRLVRISPFLSCRRTAFFTFLSLRKNRLSCHGKPWGYPLTSMQNNRCVKAMYIYMHKCIHIQASSQLHNNMPLNIH